jgi:hypothetical protein
MEQTVVVRVFGYTKPRSRNRQRESIPADLDPITSNFDAQPASILSVCASPS